MSHRHDSPDFSHLDALLDRSAPTLSHPDGLDAALNDVVADARSEARIRKDPRRTLAVLAAVGVLAGSGTAAAATLGGWTAPWAQDPAGTIEFTLPSGGACEMRIGDLDSSTDGVADELRSWLDDHTLEEIADIDAQIEADRAGRSISVRSDGSRFEVGYGTDHYDADFEYVTAVRQAINRALLDKAEELGLSASVADPWLESAGEIQCDGDNPEPFTPPWSQ